MEKILFDNYTVVIQDREIYDMKALGCAKHSEGTDIV